MILFLIFTAFEAFPNRKDGIFANNKKENIIIDTSGSYGAFHFENDKCYQTFGNETINPDEKKEWCSNIVKNDENVFIQYSIKEKLIKISKFAVRNGCCFYGSTCYEEANTTKIIDGCCRLYSYTLGASNDKIKWTKIYSVEKDPSFSVCQSKTFDLKGMTNPYKYFRFSVDEEFHEHYKCMQINQIELYGETVSDDFLPEIDENRNGEEVSIIGKLNRVNK